MRTEPFPLPEMLGQYRQFGQLGPAYKIVIPLRPVGDNDWLLLIQIAETGEKVEYRFSRAEQDPVVH
ncbi:DUF5397 family protein [Candidatus Fukatsuia symbiotica]|uniref:Uncharacterized protein n=1 Tax=Candidatus Fukatsuia symbiotica TaxID=1878942 RepID=A0A2U8I8T7_9GAMM|nr:DUF5397 family protein [Candidatus Fukatsuia symbiotica]AWK15596.1 hypothetical protein CCS41_14335 [Candidatus Fukatsuia symbiotica]MEA9446248.1 DUF5397 family protein [Candidatus Fukatsuia symbiotica]